MKRISILIVFIVIMTALLSSKTIKGYNCQSERELKFEIDSIAYRQDLTRVYGRAIGVPHTSARIDAVKMEVACCVLDATDIDGVDFNRYFQWEDDGQISLEIDFQAIMPAENLQILFITSHGVLTTTAKTDITKR